MITISRAKVNEAQEIRELEQRVWEENVTSRYDMPMFVKFGHVFVAKDNGRIIGVVYCYLTKDKKLFVPDWAVDKNYQGKGIGLKLYERLIKEVNGTPIITFIHHENIASLGAHKKLGFKVIKKVDDPYKIKEKHLDQGLCYWMELENRQAS